MSKIPLGFVSSETTTVAGWLEQVDVRNLVFIDEAGIHVGMARLFARAFRRERAVDAVPQNHGTNI